MKIKLNNKIENILQPWLVFHLKLKTAYNITLLLKKRSNLTNHRLIERKDIIGSLRKTMNRMTSDNQTINHVSKERKKWSYWFCTEILLCFPLFGTRTDDIFEDKKRTIITW